MSQRFLTKSRFKLGLECPTKLFYTGKKDIYYDNKFDNDFLRALAEGGFQVGELAKCYFEGGIEVQDLDYNNSIEQTNELLKQEEVTIYEGAFQTGNLFVRSDIIQKKGNVIRLYEVKAKSFHPGEDSFISSKGGILSKWEPYLYDVAFQKLVIQKSHPEYKVFAHLILSDKSAKATVEGLNQFFFIYKDNDRYKVKKSGDLELQMLGANILTVQNVDDICNFIMKDEAISFEKIVTRFSDHYMKDEKIFNGLGSICSKCEFKTYQEMVHKGYKSGFHECWAESKLTQQQIEHELLLSLWDFRKKQEFISQGKFLMSDVTREDLEPKAKKKETQNIGLSRVDRQWLQVQKAVTKDITHFLDSQNLKNVLTSWKFPLHFIDFETTSVAIPFNSGRRPYEQIAFQYSHHIIHENGSIAHKGEWISTKTGSFPNFDFVRALKKELSEDDGTIFRYAAHENTILNVIYRQLKESNEPDAQELCEWIKSITSSTNSSAEKWVGERAMIDLRELVVKYYYNPLTRGSNSIKQVLPAVLNTSEFLKSKYCQPIYGTTIPSFNFQSQVWVTFREGNLVNPYELLPAIHEEGSNESMDEILVDEETGIADGGAAMIAFAKMQFTEMSEEERLRIRSALLRYCELDTLAMVMIYEAMKDWCK